MIESANQFKQLERQLHLLHAAANEVAAGLGQVVQQIGESTPNSKEASSSPCDTCSEYENCNDPCEELLQMLPPLDAGQGPRNAYTKIPLELLNHDQINHRPDSRDLMDRFKACRSELTPKRWEVVWLVHGLGLNQKEAALRLSKAESTVSELLVEATKTMNAFHSRNSGNRQNTN